MKKTIAILLVLVIGMAGVFAADTHADLELTTEIGGFNRANCKIGFQEPCNA